ncbi:VanZ family protein [Streptomyces sp. KR55]|uniref:VanZ family protein n=1 Tax=Streptomyces sp. KR55 TaxID=3457425 RepID=UPI003FD56DA0
MVNLDFTVSAAMVLVPALVLFAVLVLLRARAGSPGWTGRHALLRLGGALYAAAVLQLTIFPLHVVFGTYANQTPWYEMVQWVPLIIADFSFVPNVIMMLPLGALLPLMSVRVSSPGRAVLAGAGISLAIELTQMLSYILFSNGRSVDINDVIANTLGTVLGFLALRWAARARSLAGLVQELALPSARPVGIPATGHGHAGPASRKAHQRGHDVRP